MARVPGYGGELVVAGRFTGTGKTQLLVEGTFQGKKHVEEFPVEVALGGELAARGWAEIQTAKELDPATERERNLVAATEAFFRDPDGHMYEISQSKSG